MSKKPKRYCDPVLLAVPDRDLLSCHFESIRKSVVGIYAIELLLDEFINNSNSTDPIGHTLDGFVGCGLIGSLAGLISVVDRECSAVEKICCINT